MCIQYRCNLQHLAVTKKRLVKQTTTATMQPSNITAIKEQRNKTIVYFNACDKMMSDGSKCIPTYSAFFFFFFFFFAFFYCWWLLMRLFLQGVYYKDTKLEFKNEFFFSVKEGRSNCKKIRNLSNFMWRCPEIQESPKCMEAGPKLAPASDPKKSKHSYHKLKKKC